MKANPKSRQTPHGFTLLEMLVVTSIITLLIAVLLPALGKSREVARRAVCASNVRQQGAGVLGYTVDHLGHFPNYVPAMVRSNVLFAGTRGYSNLAPVNSPHPANNYGADRRPVNPYIGVPRSSDPDRAVDVARCPSDRGTPEVWDDPTVTTYYLFGNSYIYNYYSPVLGRPSTLSTAKTRDVKVPQFTVMTGDATLWNYYEAVDRGQRWHDPKKPTANVVFVDGHTMYAPVVMGHTTKHYTFVP